MLTVESGSQPKAREQAVKAGCRMRKMKSGRQDSKPKALAILAEAGAGHECQIRIIDSGVGRILRKGWLKYE